MVESLISILYECWICIEAVRDKHVTTYSTETTINIQRFQSGIFYSLSCVCDLLMGDLHPLEAQTLLSKSVTFSSPIEMWRGNTIGFESFNLLIYLSSTGKLLKLSFPFMTVRFKRLRNMSAASFSKAPINTIYFCVCICFIWKAYEGASETLNQEHKSDIAFQLLLVQLGVQRIPHRRTNVRTSI